MIADVWKHIVRLEKELDLPPLIDYALNDDDFDAQDYYQELIEWKQSETRNYDPSICGWNE